MWGGPVERPVEVEGFSFGAVGEVEKPLPSVEKSLFPSSLSPKFFFFFDTKQVKLLQ